MDGNWSQVFVNELWNHLKEMGFTYKKAKQK